MYFLDRQYDAALSEVHLRLEAQPNNVAVLWILSDTSRRKGNYKEALEASERMLAATGDAKSARQRRLAYEKAAGSASYAGNSACAKVRLRASMSLP
jgi:predicted Zn-dependent protease